MILISVGLTLLALAGGMFLLAKTNKDNLGAFFRIIAWFIIVGSFLNLGCSALGFAAKIYHKGHGYKEMKMHKKYKRNHGKKDDCGYMERTYRDCGCMMNCMSACNRMNKNKNMMQDCCDTKGDSCAPGKMMK